MELLPELMKLTEDEESAVRLTAFDTIINLMEILDSGESSASPEGRKSILAFRRLGVFRSQTKQTADEEANISSSRYQRHTLALLMSPLPSFY